MSFENYSFENEELGIESREDKNIYDLIRRNAEDLLEKFDFFDEKDVVEINPEKIKEEVPVFVSPGWGSSPESEMDTLKIISEEGERKVISVNFSREEKIKDEDSGELPAAELQKALAIIDIINSKDLVCVDGIGHSEGGLNLAIAASLFPEKFRNLVFVCPAGSINISRRELAKRFVIDERLEEIKNIDKTKILSFYTYLRAVVKNALKNPVLSNKEVTAMTELNIFEMTKWLKEKGVGVGFIASADDKVFPVDEINESVNNENIDNYITTKGNHSAFVFDQQYARLVENLLDNMKTKNIVAENNE